MAPLELLICFTLIAISAFLSATEVALFSLSRFQLRQIRENFRASHRKIRKLLDDPAGLLTTILVSNEVVNISLSTLVTKSVLQNWTEGGPRWIQALNLSFLPDWALQMIVGLVITTPLVLVLCEASPKVIATRLNQLIAPAAVGPMSTVYSLFRPIRFLVLNSVGFISKKLGLGNRVIHHEDSKLLREDDFMLMVEEGQKEGLLQQNEVELIQNVFNLDDTPVSEVCIPIASVHSLSIQTPVQEALAFAQKHSLQRIPVYRDVKKTMIGVLYTKDLIFSQLLSDSTTTESTIEALLRPPLFVPHTTRLNRVFRILKTNQTHLALVQNDQNHCIGIITMDDVLDDIFEDFFPREASLPVGAKTK